MGVFVGVDVEVGVAVFVGVGVDVEVGVGVGVCTTVEADAISFELSASKECCPTIIAEFNRGEDALKSTVPTTEISGAAPEAIDDRMQLTTPPVWLQLHPVPEAVE